MIKENRCAFFLRVLAIHPMEYMVSLELRCLIGAWKYFFGVELFFCFSFEFHKV